MYYNSIMLWLSKKMSFLAQNLIFLLAYHTMNDNCLVLSSRNRQTSNHLQLDGPSLSQLVVRRQPIEVLIAENKHSTIWLQTTIEFGHMTWVETLCVTVHLLIGCHLSACMWVTEWIIIIMIMCVCVGVGTCMCKFTLQSISFVLLVY